MCLIMTDDIFAPIKESTVANQRKAIRYYSSTNKATVTFKRLFRSRKSIDILIINISSKGARISAIHKFSIKAKIILNLKIEGEAPWQVPAKIVSLYNNTEYGIAFDSVQHELIDQIMHHETDFNIA